MRLERTRCGSRSRCRLLAGAVLARSVRIFRPRRRFLGSFAQQLNGMACWLGTLGEWDRRAAREVNARRRRMTFSARAKNRSAFVVARLRRVVVIECSRVCLACDRSSVRKECQFLTPLLMPPDQHLQLSPGQCYIISHRYKTFIVHPFLGRFL